MSQTHGIALNQDKEYFSQVSLNDFKKSSRTNNTYTNRY